MNGIHKYERHNTNQNLKHTVLVPTLEATLDRRTYVDRRTHIPCSIWSPKHSCVIRQYVIGMLFKHVKVVIRETVLLY